jgi:hypothetical protein
VCVAVGPFVPWPTCQRMLVLLRCYCFLDCIYIHTYSIYLCFHSCVPTTTCSNFLCFFIPLFCHHLFTFLCFMSFLCFQFLTNRPVCFSFLCFATIFLLSCVSCHSFVFNSLQTDPQCMDEYFLPNLNLYRTVVSKVW